jgi:uncharacterized protein YfbU (UPF0304 family)
MWKTKYFKTEDQANQFMIKNALDYQMVLTFVQDGYGVEYKEVRRILFCTI